MYRGMELKTVQELLAYWGEWIAREQPGMPDNDPEDIKGHIAHVAVKGHFEEWEQKYHIIREVVDIAHELDLPDALSRDHKEAWEGIKVRVMALKEQVERVQAQ
jgi:hypothetical protein